MQPVWPLFQPQIAEVVDPGVSPFLPTCYTRASNPLDMTKLFFTVVRYVLFHQTNAGYVNIGLITEVYIQYTTFGFRPHVFPIVRILLSM
jgi:hypothetical protein